VETKSNNHIFIFLHAVACKCPSVHVPGPINYSQDTIMSLAHHPSFFCSHP